MTKPPYRGRFAPSPSGPLHFGSLVCALASYLDAKAHHGTWLLRVEDIDPPREQAGASALICHSLEAHGLLCDEAPLYQSQRAQAYEQTLNNLHDAGVIYRCACTRKRLTSLNGKYDGFCRTHPPAENRAAALRLNIAHARLAKHIEQASQFVDGIQGHQAFDLGSSGDFVVHRKDGLFAYQLAVVVDDIFQGITHVVRGVDLLDTNAQQRLLFYLFDSRPPKYAHVPIIVDEQGNKLSKQNHAPAIDNDKAKENLLLACRFLSIDTHQFDNLNIKEILTHATEQWSMQRLHKQHALTLKGGANE